MPAAPGALRGRRPMAFAIVAALLLSATACASSDDGSPAPTAPGAQTVAPPMESPDGAAIPDATTTSTPKATTTTSTTAATVAATTTTSTTAATVVATTTTSTTAATEVPGPSLTEADVAALERDLDELDALLQQAELDLQQD